METSVQKLEARPVDEATKVAIEQAQAELRQGEGVPLEEVRGIVRKRYELWRKTQQEVLAA